MPDEGAATTKWTSTWDRFKIQMYLVNGHDRQSVGWNEKKRMKAYDDISKIFRFLSESELSLSNEKIEEKAKNIVLLVSGWLGGSEVSQEDTLAAELIQFAAFVRTQKPVTVNEYAELTMYKLLSSLNLSQTFPNCVAHLSVHDGVQCVRRAELPKVGENQRGSAIFNGAARKAKHADAYEQLSMSMSYCAALSSQTRSKNSCLLRLAKQK